MKKYKFEFDKFVKDLEKRQRVAEAEKENIQEDETYARQYENKYREHPHNQIKYDRKTTDDK